MIIINKGSIVISTYTNKYVWCGFCVTWDYHNIVTIFNILGKELIIEVIHHRWHKSRWNKNYISWFLIINNTTNS